MSDDAKAAQVLAERMASHYSFSFREEGAIFVCVDLAQAWLITEIEEGGVVSSKMIPTSILGIIAGREEAKSKEPTVQ